MAAHIRHRAHEKRREIVLMVESPQTGSPGARPQAVVFEYSRRAFHSMQEMVLDGCRNFPQRKHEVAGVLYGTREGNIVRVQVVRRIACEHAQGWALLFSTNDKAALKEQLTREAAEPALQGLAVVGWFLSHTAPIRTAMTASGRTVLSFADLQTSDAYFGTPGQATLVLRPDALATTRASVFVRRADGSVNAEHSDLDFPFTERAAFRDPPEGVDSKRAPPSAPAVRETALAAAVATNVATKAATISVSTGRQTVPATVPVTSPSAEAASAAPAGPREPTAPAVAPGGAALPLAEPVAPATKNTSTAVSPAQPRVPEPEPTADPLAAADGRVALPATRVASPPGLKTYPSFGSYSEPAPWFTFEFAEFLKGPWGIGAGLVLLVGLALMPLGVRYYRSQPEPVPISLTVSEHDRRIQVRWDRSSRIIGEAVRGSIEFVDGEQSRTAALSADDLLHGNVTYMRQTDDVQVRLEVENTKGQITQEVVHFIEPHP
jgi:hypothetical protein